MVPQAKLDSDYLIPAMLADQNVMKIGDDFVGEEDLLDVQARLDLHMVCQWSLDDLQVTRFHVTDVAVIHSPGDLYSVL